MIGNHARDHLAMPGDSDFRACLDFGEEAGEVGFASTTEMLFIGVLQLMIRAQCHPVTF
jgi:hypothetical protein